jgi:hypothetical protein
MNIYFEGLGYRNPISDYEQIKWYFNQVAKSKPKGHDTRYWLNLREWYAEKLFKMEAYELLALIINKATDAKEKKKD